MEEDPYRSELVRYLHLNPVRAQVVPSLRALERFPWTGHSALCGTAPRAWKETAAILVQFGRTVPRARAGIAYLWVEYGGHPARPLAPVLGVSPQAVYQAVARGHGDRAMWERLRLELELLGNVPHHAGAGDRPSSIGAPHA